MKMTLLPLLLTLSIIISNDAPNWLDIPLQSISEDCSEGCTNNIFSFDLEPFVDDPDGDDLSILDPVLISGEIDQLYINSFILNIIPAQDFFGNIVIEITADDGELTASTNFTLNVEPINDAPNWLDIPLQSISEDCSEGCTNNIFSFDLEPFIDDPDGDVVTLLGPVLNSGQVEQLYVSSYTLYVIPVSDFFGEINIQLIIDDGELTGSTEFILNVDSINDIPYFSNLGDIIIDEDQTYNDNWAFDISPGAYNENQQLFFIVTFDNPDLIESYTLTPQGEFTIVPVENAYGQTNFEVYAQDEEFAASDTAIYSLTINSVNDIPVVNDQNFIIYDEDCGEESCDNTNKLILDIGMFDVYDVEDDVALLTLFIDHDNINDHYTTDGDLGILIDQDYNSENEGVITVPVYITDTESAQSEIFDCDIVINPINDNPYFSNLGDIIIDEDQTYNDNWAFDISPGAYNENQQLFFIVTFDNPDLIESYTLTPQGEFTIVPVENAYGQTNFEVYAQDEEFAASDTAIYSLTINSVNDIPVVNDQNFIIYDEDCGEESCDNTNKLILDIGMFDVYDVEDDVALLTLFIDHDNINDHYTTDGDLGILIDQDYNSENEGVITVPVYITDTESAQSEIFDCDIVINPINDNPYFSNLGDIIINEDNNYYQNWAFDISKGAYNENQDLFFTVTFDNPDLIESYILDPEGYFTINPNEHANGQSVFTIYLTDEQFGESEVVSHLLTINPVNDPPLFEFNPSFYNIDEDSGEHIINWAFNINPGGGNDQYKETDQELIFIIENTYDQILFNELPDIIINQENEGILSFSLLQDMNGATELSITLQDNGDNKLTDDDDSNDGFNISQSVNFPIQINQINDIPVEFSLFSDLRNYQIDETTFYTFENDEMYFRYPYQSVYIDNQLPNKLRFEWEWVDSLDIDIYPSINKDILMESIFYRLEVVETSNPNNIIILADSLIYNVSNSDKDYEVDTQNNTVRIDIDLNEINSLDLSGDTPYHWRVIAQNYQLDYQDSDPPFYSENEDYYFYIDITLPVINMIPLYDDIFSENFDLYMLSTERLIDFDGLNRPIKLWIDYGINGSDDEILFPNEIDTLNYIYYLPHSFSNSGDIRLKYQMRDHVQNINAGLEDISFGIIDPIYNSTLNFFNGFITLDVPKNSVNNKINCLIRNHKTDEVYNNLEMIGDIIEIYPNDMQLINDANLSIDLNMINSLYDNEKLSIYKMNDNIWEKCETYIENKFLKTNINQFGFYAIFYNDNHNTETLLPDHYLLKQNYPNPFNPNTTIEYYIPEANNIDLIIYNIKGEKVRTLYSGYLNSGYHSIIWDGHSDSKIELPSGIYIVSFNFNNQTITNKLVKIK